MDKVEERRRHILCQLASTMQTFQRTIVTRRRRAQQRAARRQTLLHNLFMQQMMEFETCYLELLPLKALFRTQQHNFSPTPAAEKTQLVKQENGKERASESSTEETHNDGYYHLAMSSFTDDQWLMAFRMSRHTFKWLCAELHDHMTEQTTQLPLELRVAIGLYAFVSGEDYRVMALLFNVSRLAARNVVLQLAEALIQKFEPSLIRMPKDITEYVEIRTNFQNISGMPPVVVGALGVCEIPLNLAMSDAPNEQELREVLHGRSNSILLQTIIDDRLLFRKVRVNNAPALLLEGMEETVGLLPQTINDVIIPNVVIAPPVYPMRPWLLRSYAEPGSTHQIEFNKATDKIMAIKDKALKRLFGRWRILQRKTSIETQKMERIALACCVLHNLLEEVEETYMDEWHECIDENKWQLVRFKDNNIKNRDSREALEVRQRLARTIGSNRSRRTI